MQRSSHILVLLPLIVVAASTPDRAAAASFDGRWSVLVITRKGTCDVYRWTVGVRNGRISDTGDSTARASGAIAGDGRLSITLTRGAQVMRASGRVSGKWGRGNWVSPSRGCSGEWRAERVG